MRNAVDRAALNRALAKAYPGIKDPQDRRRKLGKDLRYFLDTMVELAMDAAQKVKSGDRHVGLLPSPEGIEQALERWASYSDNAAEKVTELLLEVGPSGLRFNANDRNLDDLETAYRMFAEFIELTFVRDEKQFDTDLMLEILSA